MLSYENYVITFSDIFIMILFLILFRWKFEQNSHTFNILIEQYCYNVQIQWLHFQQLSHTFRMYFKQNLQIFHNMIEQIHIHFIHLSNNIATNSNRYFSHIFQTDTFTSFSNVTPTVLQWKSWIFQTIPPGFSGF